VDIDIFMKGPKPDFTDITEEYVGRAPDLGAYEYGAALPHYRPRP
jgi:hypothetical protein